MAWISPLILWFTSFCLAASNPALLPSITANADTVSGIQQQFHHIKCLCNYNPKRLDVMKAWGNMIFGDEECILLTFKLIYRINKEQFVYGLGSCIIGLIGPFCYILLVFSQDIQNTTTRKLEKNCKIHVKLDFFFFFFYRMFQWKLFYLSCVALCACSSQSILFDILFFHVLLLVFVSITFTQYWTYCIT